MAAETYNETASLKDVHVMLEKLNIDPRHLHRLPPHVIEICEVKDKVSNTQVIGQSQDRLSRSCVNYFKQPEILQENWVDDSEKVEEMKAQKYSFLNYAIEKWSIHAEKAERQGQCQKHLVKQMEEPPVFFKVYINMLRAVAIHNYGVQQGSTVLHLMAYANLQGPAQEIIQRGDSIEDQDQSRSRPLHCAAYQGHKEMVELLLDAGADIKATQDAIGADVNPESKFGGTPLKQRRGKAHADIVRLLLNKGASIDEYDDYNGTALQTAAWAGQIEVVQILLENGASVNAQGGNFGSALQCAADATSLYNNIGATMELLELLLDYGADVNMGGGPWGSPFAAAVRGLVQWSPTM
ncbi:hypothetical protein DID88_009317 [Monilinia fructigena]|uniref:Uncharacterized protein n=1 Tax=Monilinia fructigena TaxID=38457 RepID=A0A395IET9_9HELO|nr:hypothetical protein DID88_009317 [Monilinia fructigena]